MPHNPYLERKIYLLTKCFQPPPQKWSGRYHFHRTPSSANYNYRQGNAMTVHSN